MYHVFEYCLCVLRLLLSFFFFFNDTATTEIYTLSLHDALPISRQLQSIQYATKNGEWILIVRGLHQSSSTMRVLRSEEHTSELQSQSNLVCRLLLEKKKKHNKALRTATASYIMYTTSPYPTRSF